MPLNKIVEQNDIWVEHLKNKDVPDSHRMFTTESYFLSFWKYAAHGVVLLDEHCRIIEANTAFLSLIGSDLAEIVTKELKDILPACELNTDYTIINAIIEGDEYSLTKEEDIRYKFGTSKFIPVKVVATRIPSALGLQFKHMIVHVYDMRTPHHGFDYQPNEYKNLDWGTLAKQIIHDHFNAVLILLGALICLLAFTGNLGDTISKLIDKTIDDNAPKVEHVEKHNQPCEHERMIQEALRSKVSHE